MMNVSPKIKLKIYIVVIFGIHICAAAATSDSHLEVVVDNEGGFNVTIGGIKWLNGAPTFVSSGGEIYSTQDKSLVFHSSDKDTGEDTIGPWVSLRYWFFAGDRRVGFSFKSYIKKTFVVFTQEFPDGLDKTSVGDKDKLISRFPSFMVPDNATEVDLGYLAYGYIMTGDMGKTMGRYKFPEFRIRNGRNSGPICLFDHSSNALFITPFNEFMSASALYDPKESAYGWGIMGDVQNIPKGFSSSYILYYSDEGINAAISGWGQVMRTYYNKDRSYRESDFTNNYLSYWSDNGAYYVNYYVAGGLIQGLTYEEAMLGVKTYADITDLPYRSFQYSVWFEQGNGGGNKRWNASSLLFPHGMQNMYTKTRLPSTAHSRYWSSDSPYAKQNGGKYEWIIEGQYSLPMDQQFWTDMFQWSSEWGFKCYMQDWLNIQFDSMNATTQDVRTARTWLMQMGEGARRNGMTVQYCMSESRHILQSLEIPTVTQARASDDYQPGTIYDKGSAFQFKIGISSMFADAVGIAPFKDTFWSSSVQPHNHYHSSEPYPALQCLVATLSTGPVGPGDMIGGTNRDLVMKCCSTDGLILKPSKPAMSIDAQVQQAAFKDGKGPDGELWSTYSDIGRYRFGIIFATDMNNTFKVGPSNAGFKIAQSKIYKNDIDLTFQVPLPFDDVNNTVAITSLCTTRAYFCLYYTTPVLTFQGQELLLIGELAKWVPMSAQRVLSIQYDEADFLLKLRGNVGEEVSFTYMWGGKASKVLCVFGDSGTAMVSVVKAQCNNM